MPTNNKRKVRPLSDSSCDTENEAQPKPTKNRNNGLRTPRIKHKQSKPNTNTIVRKIFKSKETSSSDCDTDTDEVQATPSHNNQIQSKSKSSPVKKSERNHVSIAKNKIRIENISSSDCSSDSDTEDTGLCTPHPVKQSLRKTDTSSFASSSLSSKSKDKEHESETEFQTSRDNSSSQKCFLCQKNLDPSNPELVLSNSLKQCISNLLGIRNKEIETELLGPPDTKSCFCCFTICTESELQLKHLIIYHQKLWSIREKIKDLLVEGNPLSRSINELCKSESSSKISNCRTLKDPKIALLQCLNSFQKYAEIDFIVGDAESPVKSQNSIFLETSRSNPQKPSDDFRIKCPKCTRHFLFEAHLNQHLQLHSDNSVNCVKCGKLFGNNAKCGCVVELNCPNCARTFPNKSLLRKHLKLHNEKSVNCTKCGQLVIGKRGCGCFPKKNKTSSILKYKCPKCTRAFSSPSKLKRHLPLHTKNSVNCIKCGKLVRKKSNCGCFLKRTKKEIYGTIGSSLKNQYEYKCPKCTRTFVNKGALAQHLPLHNENSVNCIKCGKLFGKKKDCGCFQKKTKAETTSNVTMTTTANFKNAGKFTEQNPKTSPCRYNKTDPDYNFVFINPERSDRLCSKKSNAYSSRKGKLQSSIEYLYSRSKK